MNSVQQNLPWGIDSNSASQEITGLLWKPKVPYRVGPYRNAEILHNKQVSNQLNEVMYNIYKKNSMAAKLGTEYSERKSMNQGVHQG